MSDKIEQAGSWAQNDVIQILNENGVLPKKPKEFYSVTIGFK